MKISEIEKQILNESEEVSIQNILREFRLLTNDLEHLLYPSLLESEEKVNVEKEMKSFEVSLKRATSDFSMIAFLLTGFLDKDGKAKPLKESEQKQLDEYFTSFKNTLSNLMSIAASFVIVMQNEPQKEGTFSKVASKQVAEFLEYYDLICEYVTDESVIKKVNDSYFAYIGLMRVINTAIKYYNTKWPDYRFNYIRKIPKPSFQEGNLLNYLATLKHKIDQGEIL